MAEAIALLPNPLQQGQGARHWVMETQLAPKLIGTPAKRLDAPTKVNGRAIYGIDVRPPGVKIATLVQSPVFGGRVKSVDGSSISTNFVSCGVASTRRRRRRTSVASCCCKPFGYQRSHAFWAEQFHA